MCDAELAYMILRTLRTSSIAAIVERLYPLLHLDPIAYLPPELTFHVFSYLNPSCLLVAASVSRAWRTRALDPRLWRRLYRHEGWATEHREVRKFESTIVSASPDRKSRMTRTAAQGSSEEQRSKKRIVQGVALSNGDKERSRLAMEATSATLWNEQHGTVEADSPSPTKGLAIDSRDEEMDDAYAPEPETTPASAARSNNHPRLMPRRRASVPTSGTTSLWQPQLILPTDQGDRKLNWLYLFKQRRRLEENWNAGRFVTFQLPHPLHPEEAHRECVYTIQHCGRYLVSGSRDKTIRVWDLDSQRLVKGPLYGHHGSVLCLQFDAREEEDVIISGSSDTDVIIWKFSTGEQVRKIRHAHSEPILNLKFDHRYLVTCSKDKTIKVWSRQLLEATNQDFPMAAVARREKATVFPSHIINLAHSQELINEGRLASTVQLDTVPAYSLLMSFKGHDAAVNAIQLFGDQIVSASGDRKIKIWNVRTGVCDQTIHGHNKGIACVQYDGRRIVSGSSDNSVKIFDRTGAEVACLLGHQDLVRTVQAGFGDIPGHEDDERVLAHVVDEQFYEACDRGQVQFSPGTRSGARTRNAGSRDPTKITTVGASVPPGGGGSRWGRIVSGSYDETIIIWKRDADGKWVIGHKLFQEEAALAAGGRPPPSLAQGTLRPLTMQYPATTDFAAASGLLHSDPTASALNSASPALAFGMYGVPASPNINQALFSMTTSAMLQQQQQQQQTLSTTSGSNYSHAQVVGGADLTMGPGAAATVHLQAHYQSMQAQQSQFQQLPPPPPQQQQHLQPQQHHLLQMAVPTMANVSVATAAAMAAAATTHSASAGLAPAPAVANDFARVFKLQFDARRIICCSSDPKIVGWDFANGDEKLAEASRFFQGL